ncbi:MAG: ATP phosphoribosyltransferase [Candidatus Tectomicrobia bacterium]|uniref:ATP phosphoribosyltransferase n=1 Tax=Tectimicrobiota bacterium TaxID=2528274 RepID=A0A933LQ50_UNCTE|nr:ATP phosphoribosyltransferase [Candidatus Tectomicrobia bacterium]
MKVKLALPKGEIQAGTVKVLQRVGLEIRNYDSKSRNYRPRIAALPEAAVKVFSEKDVPIQVAVGNYQLGICGLDWIEELKIKYPAASLSPMIDLGFGQKKIWACVSEFSAFRSLHELTRQFDGRVMRIVSEYPNLAEMFAFRMRLKAFKIFPVWGAAEAYPPEDAELAIVSAFSEEGLAGLHLYPVEEILSSSVHLTVNSNCFERQDLSALIAYFYKVI